MHELISILVAIGLLVWGGIAISMSLKSRRAVDPEPEHHLLERLRASEQTVEQLMPSMDCRYPDDLAPVRVYTYRQFMKPAFEVLSAIHRYNKPTLLAVQSDWVHTIWGQVACRTTY